MSITLRVRTQVGTYRLNDVAPTDNFLRIKERMLSEHSARIEGNISLEAKSSKSSAVPDTMTVQEAGLSNGHMLHAQVSEGTTMASTSTASASSTGSANKVVTIGKDGGIVVSEVTNTWAASMFGSSLTTKGGNKNTTTFLAGKKRIGLYFSAHWVRISIQYLMFCDIFIRHSVFSVRLAAASHRCSLSSTKP